MPPRPNFPPHRLTLPTGMTPPSTLHRFHPAALGPVTVLDHFIAQTLLDARPAVPNTPLPDASTGKLASLDATDGVTPPDIACPTPL